MISLLKPAQTGRCPYPSNPVPEACEAAVQPPAPGNLPNSSDPDRFAARQLTRVHAELVRMSSEGPFLD